MSAPPQIGQYAILGELGRGGMGIVYRAEDPHLKREVALKIMLPQFAANQTAKHRFVREARAQAKVEHEHVAVIHQVAEYQGLPYLVMPLLKGMTLHAALRANPRPPLPEVVRIGREMAEGLAAAHENGLVHRDIKPANIWLEGKKLRVRILDFGLARVAMDAEATQRADNDPVTREGALIGTPLYMSPEQARGLRVDGRTDLWSVGVILYQMTTGELPFNGTSPIGILTAVALDIPPSPMERNPAIPHVLSDLIMRLLSKDPAYRPPTAEALADELRGIEAALANMSRVVSLDATSPLSFQAAGPDPFAEIDATEASGVTKPAERREHSAPPPSRMWLYIGGGIAALALAVVVLLAATQGNRKPPADVVSEEPPRPILPKPKDKKDPPPSPTPQDFRDLRGASLMELQAWTKELTPRFRPVSLSVRGGTPTLMFDAIAIPDSHEWEFLTTSEGSEQNVFDTQKRRGFSPRLRVGHPVDGSLGISEVWVRDTLRESGDWASWHLSRFPLEARLKAAAAAEFAPQHCSAMAVNNRLFGAVYTTRSPGQPWTLDLDMSLEELNRKVADIRRTGTARLRAFSATFDPNKVRFSAVFYENRLQPPWWDFQSGLSPVEYERALADRKAKRQRPSSVASYVVDGKVNYAVLWEETADPDTERRVAQLLKPLTSTMTVRLGWRIVSVPRNDPLPDTEFEVVGLTFGEVRLPPEFISRTLVPAISELRALSSLRISGSVTAVELARLATGPVTETLTELMLYQCDLTPATLEQVKKFRNLTTLGLGAKPADDDLLARLKELPRLAALSLRGLDARGKVGDRGIKALASLPLRSLSLTAADLTPQQFRDIAAMPGLVTLDLEGGTADDACIVELVVAPKLETLDLSGTKVTDKALLSLEKVVTLRTVELRRTKVTERGIRHLTQARPELRVVLEPGSLEPPKKP
ncbi:MAG: protein kinase [Gemmataceae bacterium]